MSHESLRFGMTWVETADDGRLVVHGDLDIAGGRALSLAMENEPAPEGDLVIDVGDVPFVDSSGLRVLLLAAVRAEDRSALVVLRNPGPVLLHLLDVTLTADYFEIVGARS